MTEAAIKRNHKIENIRAFAILTVVVGHSIILYSSQWGLYTSDRSSILLDHIKRFINLYQMPLYFSLSGYLFTMTWKEKKFADFIINKLRRLILPFLSAGMLWMIPIKMFVHYPGYEGNSYRFAVLKLLTGADPGHLWYLPVLFIIFIVLFTAVSILGNRKSVWTVIFILSVLMHIFRKTLPVMDGIYVPYVYQYVWSFAAGALIYQYKCDRLPNPYTVSITVLTVMTAVYTLYTGRLTLITSGLILLVTYNLISAKQSGISANISRNSFGIYLLHSPLIYITFTYLLNADPLIVSGINLFIFGGTAYLLTDLIRKTKLKFMIGE